MHLLSGIIFFKKNNRAIFMSSIGKVIDQQVHTHAQVPPGEAKSKLTTLATGSDRTLFFDFLPIQAPTMKRRDHARAQESR